MDENIPPFPDTAGGAELSDQDKAGIAEAAWKQANGSINAYSMLIGEHLRGEIDLFNEGRSRPLEERNPDAAVRAIPQPAGEVRAAVEAAPATVVGDAARQPTVGGYRVAPTAEEAKAREERRRQAERQGQEQRAAEGESAEERWRREQQEARTEGGTAAPQG